MVPLLLYASIAVTYNTAVEQLYLVCKVFCFWAEHLSLLVLHYPSHFMKMVLTVFYIGTLGLVFYSFR